MLPENIRLTSTVSAPSLRRYAAASKVRTPAFITKLRVSSMMPASSASASSRAMPRPPIYCTSSATISLAEEEYGSW